MALYLFAAQSKTLGHASEFCTLYHVQLAAGDETSPEPVSDFTCDEVEKVPAEQQCSFVRAHCEAGVEG